jgi:NADH-quinone oxidoreductase subunit C
MNGLFPELSDKFPCDYAGFNPVSGGHQLRISPENSLNLLSHLHKDSAFWCDYLICLSAEHIFGEKETLRLHYYLSSYTRGHQVHVWTEKETLNGEKANFQSVSHIWKTADWHERECAELGAISWDKTEIREIKKPGFLKKPGFWEASDFVRLVFDHFQIFFKTFGDKF